MKKKKKETLVDRLSKKMKSKKISKKGITTITIKEREPSNIFHEESKFFKSELCEAKRDMFFL